MKALFFLAVVAFSLTVALSAMLLTSCATPNPGETGFAIRLAETGEVIIADEHIAAYIWDQHRIIFSPEGVERWDSLATYDHSQDPPLRLLGSLNRKEFVITVEGAEMYRGHFWSMLSSLLRNGVLIYDTAVVMRDGLHLSFTQMTDALLEDPRDNPKIEAYFREQGKLR